MEQSNRTETHSLVNSSFPVLLPYFKELYVSEAEFTTYLESLRSNTVSTKQNTTSKRKSGEDDKQTSKKRQFIAGKHLLRKQEVADAGAPTSAFMDALRATANEAANTIRTENADKAFRSTNSPLVDLFFELEAQVNGKRLGELLEAAWEEDSDATLKIIFNARSIHLGKSSRSLAYKALGWLYKQHPVTLLMNLKWLVQPVIEKKVPRTEGDGKDTKVVEATDDDELTLVEMPKEDDIPVMRKTVKLTDDFDIEAYNVKYGCSHGYWKDLVNLLVLAAEDKLDHKTNPDSVLKTVKAATKKKLRDWCQDKAKKRKQERLEEAHSRVAAKLENDLIYRALHLTIARLFAAQLRRDSQRVASLDKEQMKLVSLAAKWAPSPKESHDQATFVVSSIAEILHDPESLNVDKTNREQYLKHAREAYRRLTLSPLRKFLDVVERKITASTFNEIKYEKLPSLAMNRYQSLFIEKDFDHFNTFVDRVAGGKSKISGAVLLPSVLVKKARERRSGAARSSRQLIDDKILDGQWRALVQRIRNSGTLQSSIAVCDVSGSMSGPRQPDGTCPLDSSVGLSLLLAEVVEPPFGGAFISFSADPQIHQIGGQHDTRTLTEKVQALFRFPMGYNTDFVAVFERCILPLAKRHRLRREDMVKQVFVFSDMHFDAAAGRERYDGRRSAWASSYERIKSKFDKAGYEMPQLVFWNLAGGRTTAYGESVAPKPVTATEQGTALVSGYSQALMKVFLDGGRFEEDVEEEEDKVTAFEDSSEDEELVQLRVQKKEAKKSNPLAVVRKAINHPAYAMLKVVD